MTKTLLLKTQYIKTTTNAITKASHGFKIITTSITVRLLNIPNVAKTHTVGNRLSNIAMSLENLVKTLPTGLESKNRIVALITLVTIWLCIFDELVSAMLNITRALTNERRI